MAGGEGGSEAEATAAEDYCCRVFRGQRFKENKPIAAFNRAAQQYVYPGGCYELSIHLVIESGEAEGT